MATWAVSLVPQEDRTATLHAYTNLIRIPVLVLTGGWGTHQAVPEGRFLLSVDGGPSIRLKHVRRRGNDAIELSILLDAADEADKMLPEVGVALRQLTPEYLLSM